jgi:hypothetical protein
LLAPLLDKPIERNYNQSILSDGRYNAVNTINNYKLQDAFLRQNISRLLGSNTETFIAINRGKTIRLFENEHYSNRLTQMGLTPHSAFGCMVRYLFAPKPSIFLSVLPEMRRLINEEDVIKIGIHIRTGDKHLMGDHTSSPGLNGFHHHFDCAQQIESFPSLTGRRVMWYLLTDSATLRSEAVAKFGDKLTTSLALQIEHSSKEASVCTSNCKVDPLFTLHDLRR